MLEANSQTLTVTANTDITFANINIQTGITAVLDSDNATIRLNRPGIYRVDFTAYGSSTAAGTIGAQLYANDTAVNRASSVAGNSIFYSCSSREHHGRQNRKAECKIHRCSRYLE